MADGTLKSESQRNRATGERYFAGPYCDAEKNNHRGEEAHPRAPPQTGLLSTTVFYDTTTLGQPILGPPVHTATVAVFTFLTP